MRHWKSVGSGVCGLALFGLAGWAQTLDQTISASLANDPTLARAMVDVDIANARIRGAESARRFQVTATGSSVLQSVGTNRNFALDIGETVVAQGQIEATLPLYTGGRIEAGIEQARAGRDAAMMGVSAEEQAVILAAISAHLRLRQTEEVVRIRLRNVERLAEQRQAATDRFEIGVITRTDVSLSEARFRAAEAGLALAEAERAGALADYVALTGFEPEALAPPGKPPELPESYDAALNILMVQNPTLKQLAAAERAATEAMRVAEAEKKPQISAFGSAALQEGRWDNDFRDTTATIGARASVPLYTGGRIEASIDEARATRDRARLSQRVAELQLTASLARAWSGYDAAQKGLVASSREVDASKIALEGAEVELEVGLRTTLDLLDQEQDLLEAELRLAEARVRVYESAAQIMALIGGLNDQAG